MENVMALDTPANKMSESEQEVVEGTLDEVLPDGISYHDRGDRYVITDSETLKETQVNVAAVRGFCTADELADYTRTVATDFLNRLAQLYE